MGTKYYLNTICPTCGHHMRRYYIGKNSWGWVFHFQEIHTPYVNVTNLQGMKEITEMGVITDEYEREIPYDEFWKIVEKTKEPMPDGSPKHITHDDYGPENSFCWEKDGYAWSSMDFC